MVLVDSLRLSTYGLAAVGAVLLATCEGCSEEPNQPPVDKDPRILAVDGIEVRRSELEEFAPYLKQLDPTMGEMKRIRELLQQHLLPLKFAQRAFASERAVQRRHAEGVIRSLSGVASYDELATQTKLVPGAGLKRNQMRQDLHIPEHRWAFEDAHLGQASPILETPRGYSILATLDKRPGPTRAYDRADIWVVPFYSQDNKSYLTWWAATQKSVADKLTYIHPDFQEALPHWLQK